MANKLNLRATISLSAKEFQKGVRAIQSSLNSLRMKFMSFAATLGAGLGLAEFARNLKDTAKKMNQTQVTLKNVSNGYKEYAENQRFLIELSKKYKQEILVLTDNFAKFHSSSDQANVSLADQQKIFESLTRAATFYNLTADETNGVFLAITQMMSKGKVSSEELRRQLGERLPGAFGLMASALGMTTAELDKALRDGKVMAADALPKLADALNNVTQNLDTDTIQGWTNELSNAFTRLTKKMNIDKVYKSILRGGTNVVNWLTDNLKTVRMAIISAFSGIMGGSFWNKGKKAYDSYFSDLEAQLTKFQRRAESLHKRYYNTTVGGTSVKREVGETIYPVVGVGKRATEKQIKEFNNLKVSGELDKANNLARQYNAVLGDMQKTQEALNAKTSFFKQIWIDFKSVAKGALASLGVGAAIAGISILVQKFIDMRKEAKKIRDYIRDMDADYKKFVNQVTDEQSKLESLKDRVKNTSNKKSGDAFEDIANDKQRVKLLSAINNMLGLEGEKALKIEDTNEKINQVIDDRIALLKRQREQQIANEQLTEARNELDALQKEKKRLEDEIEDAKKKQQRARTQEESDYWGGVISQDLLAINNKSTGLLKQIADKEHIIAERAEKVTDLTLALEDSTKEIEENYGGAVESYEELQKNYYKDLATLDAKFKDGILTQDEYNKALQSLNSSTLDAVYKLAQTNDKIKVGSDAFSRMLIDSIRKNKTIDPSAVVALEKEYRVAREKLHNQFNAGLIDSTELQNGLDELAIETAKALAAMGGMVGSLEGFSQELDIAAKEGMKRKKINDFISEGHKPRLQERDTRFDYEKSESDIGYENAARYEEYAEQLKAQKEGFIKALGKEGENTLAFAMINAMLDDAIKKAESFKDAADLSKIKEDVEGLKKTAFSSITDGIGSVATSIDRLVDDMDKLGNPDISGWKKLAVILNGLVQTVEGVMKSIEMFTELEKIINKISKAEEEKQAIEEIGTQKKIQGKTAEMAIESAAQTQEAAGTASSLADSTAKVAAGEAEALAGGTASAAKLPFPANLAAIAGVIAAITAIFATLPKFEKGGLVGGHSMTGDKLLARVNSGEMILNQGQQRALLNQMNSGGQVQFKIKGSDLLGVLNNYQKKITK